MKNIVSLFSFAVLLFYVSYTGSVYDFSVPTMAGGTQNLSAYQGKKIMIITLPVEQSPAADSLLSSLDTLAAARAQSLQIIGVPAIEDGYTAGNNSALQQWYFSKMGNHVLVTGGLYTRKTSGTQQHPLFRWLTTVSQNEVFDIDVEGPGFKFFTKQNGELYGVLKPHTKVSSIAVQRTLQMQ